MSTSSPRRKHTIAGCAPPVRRCVPASPATRTISHSPSQTRTGTRSADTTRLSGLPELNRCWFAATIIAVRREYKLTIDAREAAALDAVLEGCKTDNDRMSAAARQRELLEELPELAPPRTWLAAHVLPSAPAPSGEPARQLPLFGPETARTYPGGTTFTTTHGRRGRWRRPGTLTWPIRAGAR